MSKTRMLIEVQDDGQRLILDDGSVWWIEPFNTPEAAIWIPTAELHVRELDPDSHCPFEITNAEVNETIRARREI